MKEDPNVSEGYESAIYEWFMGEFHCDYLADCLNEGRPAEENWQHSGHKAQAKANTERLLGALTEAGFEITSAAHTDQENAT